MAQELYELPDGWEWIPLGKVATLINGRAYKKNELLDDGPMPVLRVGNLFTNKHWFYSDLELPEDKYCDEGDLIYAWSASFGPRIWEGPKAIYHYHIWKILTSDQIDKKYLFYLLEKDSETIKSQGNGVGMFHATKAGMEKMLIPLPKSSVQQALVTKLDALLSRIDTAIEHLEHSLELNDQLFASSLNQAFNPLDAEIQPDGTYQLPEGWEWKTLNEIFEIARGGSPRPIKSFITDNEDGINWIKIGDVATGAKYISQTAEKIKPEGVSKSRMVYPGDFILSNSMSFGRPYIMQIEGCIHDGWLLLRPLGKTVSVDFMYQLLSSPFMYRQFSFAASGTTVKNLNSDIARNSKVPIPSPKEQAAITAKLDEVQVKTQANKQVLQQKLEQLQQLKASLLDSAFRGEL